MLGSFAKEQAAIRQSLQELPSTLQTTRSALDEQQKLSETAKPALTALIPRPARSDRRCSATRPFFRKTVGPIRTQIRPFTRKVQPVIRELNRGAKPLADCNH